MRHLLCHSVYSSVDEVYPFLLNGDGIELLTGYFPVSDEYLTDAVSVHLPYATDWYSSWIGKNDYVDGLSEEDVRYISYGRDCNEIIKNIAMAVKYASDVSPKYGVMHAGSADINELLAHDYSTDSGKVLDAFIEIMNDVASHYFDGKMPFKILFENQWWPGLKFIDDKGYRLLERKIEFDNWGLCLDTGHILVTIGSAYDEAEAIEKLNRIIDVYPQDMIDSITTVHFHVNTSADFINEYVPDSNFLKMTTIERLNAGYPYVCSMDQHRPFTMGCATNIIDRLCPEFITHEMSAPDVEKKIADYIAQRSLFD